MRSNCGYGPLSLTHITLWLTLVIFLAITVPSNKASPGTDIAIRGAQETESLAQNAQTNSQVVDATDQQGPFSIGNMQYTVLLNEKLLRSQGKGPAEATANSATLAGLQIVDSAGNAVYQETFPYTLADGRFAETLAATASMLSGTGGSALLVRFVQNAAATPGAQAGPVQESWQIFGVVNGRVSPFGPVLPLGEGKGITENGVVAGSMTANGIAVVPLASTAEALPLPVWEGNFYVFVPVRIDWTHGEWGEGEQCYQLGQGSLQQQGCVMRVNAQPQTQIGSNGGSVRLFAATDGNIYNSENVSVAPQSQLDFPQARAIVHWQYTDGRAECNFSDVWLQVRIDGKEGWVRGEQAFQTLGLPHLNPP